MQTELSKGGSFSDVGPMVKGWSLSRGFRPRPTKDDVPPAMLDSLSKVAAQIWSHGRDQGRNIKLNEHDELVEKFDALKMAYVAAMARVKALEERLGIAGTEAAGEGDGATTDTSLGRRCEATAFWNRLLGQVADLIGNQQLKPELAFKLLDADTHREAVAWSKPKKWSDAVLGDKMKGRAEEGKLFERVGENLYRSLGGKAEAAPTEVASPKQAKAEAASTFPGAVLKPERPARPTTDSRMDAGGSPEPEHRPDAATDAATALLRRLGGPMKHEDDDPGDDEGMDKARFTIDGQSIVARSRPR